MMFMEPCDGLPQSATSSTFRNMSLAKARDPRALPRVVATVVLMACIAIANASLIMSLVETVGMH